MKLTHHLIDILPPLQAVCSPSTCEVHTDKQIREKAELVRALPSQAQ